MRCTRYLLLGLAALVFGSCAMPGAIYKGYEGPDRDVKDVAVLDWSTCRTCDVSHIDGKWIHTQLSIQSYGFAHLSPGPHAIRARIRYADLGTRMLDTRIDFQAGRSYVIKEAVCFDCVPFEATFWIEDTATGKILAKSTEVGTGRYGEARESYDECIDECRSEDRRCERSGRSEKDCRMDDYWCRQSCAPSSWPFGPRNP